MFDFTKSDTELPKLAHYRDDENWKDFFHHVDSLKVLASKIQKEKPSNTSKISKLNAQAKVHLDALVEMKVTMMNEHTKKKGDVEYNAVDSIVTDFEDNYGYLPQS